MTEATQIPEAAAQALAQIVRAAGWNWQAGPEITLFVPLPVMRAFAVAMLEEST